MKANQCSAVGNTVRPDLYDGFTCGFAYKRGLAVGLGRGLDSPSVFPVIIFVNR